MRRRSKLVLTLAVALATYGAIELFSLVAYFMWQREGFSFRSVAERREQYLGVDEEGTRETTREIVKYLPHPYLGFVPNRRGPEVGDHWWIDSDVDPFREGGDALRVAIVGGSVAYNLRDSWDAFTEVLRELPGFGGEPIHRFTLAAPANKQPQQSMAVSYFLALGGKIDILINLDGFNEVGSEIKRNLRLGVHPAYPSMWAQVTRDWSDSAELQRLGEVAMLRRQRTRLAGLFEHLRYSVTANLVWQLLDTHLGLQIYRRSAADEEIEALPLHSSGPSFGGDDDAARRFSIEMWARSSLLLDRIADGQGFAYFHFLQPNQYVSGAKHKFTIVERELRLTQKRYREIIPRWYPELQAAGALLRGQGVRFFDLTRIHEDVDDTVYYYYYDCCHFTPLGRDILARSMAGIIVEEMRSRGE
ncbi:hypothetical protein N9166_01475 [bacterium]|nr:hypothetical protein [bacterium]